MRKGCRWSPWCGVRCRRRQLDRGRGRTPSTTTSRDQAWKIPRVGWSRRVGGCGVRGRRCEGHGLAVRNRSSCTTVTAGVSCECASAVRRQDARGGANRGREAGESRPWGLEERREWAEREGRAGGRKVVIDGARSSEGDASGGYGCCQVKVGGSEVGSGSSVECRESRVVRRLRQLARRRVTPLAHPA